LLELETSNTERSTPNQSLISNRFHGYVSAGNDWTKICDGARLSTATVDAQEELHSWDCVAQSAGGEARDFGLTDLAGPFSR